MFVLAAITLMSILVLLMIVYLTFGQNISTENITTWLICGLVFVLGSLGFIGLRFWACNWTRSVQKK